jgi:preprotein translocase subunit SecE
MFSKVILPSLRRENLDLGLVIVFLLVMLAIVHAIDFLLLKVMF